MSVQFVFIAVSLFLLPACESLIPLELIEKPPKGSAAKAPALPETPQKKPCKGTTSCAPTPGPTPFVPLPTTQPIMQPTPLAIPSGQLGDQKPCTGTTSCAPTT